jgi:hypothetical protein
VLGPEISDGQRAICGRRRSTRAFVELANLEQRFEQPPGQAAKRQPRRSHIKSPARGCAA